MLPSSGKICEFVIAENLKKYSYFAIPDTEPGDFSLPVSLEPHLFWWETIYNILSIITDASLLQTITATASMALINLLDGVHREKSPNIW